MAIARLTWFDANRVLAAFGVVLIHSTTDFEGQAFGQEAAVDRVVPVVLRAVGNLSGSEMFFTFSLFLLAMSVDKKRRDYRDVISLYAKRLLLPFAFWAFFYVWFRLIKAHAFDYSDSMWMQISETRNWLGYAFLGSSQYHLHFLPTLFVLILFFPLFRSATRYPLLGLGIVATLGAMANAQGYIWGLELDLLTTQFLARGAKILGYLGFGLAAFAIYGMTREGVSRGEARQIRGAALIMVLIALIAALPYYGAAVQTGTFGYGVGWTLFGLLLVPIAVFCVFLGTRYADWSPKWSEFAKYTFGIYLVHPIFVDLFDIFAFSSGYYLAVKPGLYCVTKFVFASAASVALTFVLSKSAFLAWTVGLGGAVKKPAIRENKAPA